MLLLGLGCGSKGGTVVFPLPQDSGSMLLAVEAAGKVSITAYDLDPASTVVHLPDSQRLASDTRVTALTYSAKLAELSPSLSPGPVMPGDPTSASAFGLPKTPGRTIYALDQNRAGKSAWSEVQALPPDLEAFRVAGTCAMFEPQAVAFPNLTESNVTLPISDDTAMVVVAGNSYLVHPDASFEPQRVSPSGLSFASGTIDAAGEYWFCVDPPAGTKTITFWHGHPAADHGLDLTKQALLTTTATAGMCPHAMAVGRGPSGGTEVFALYDGAGFDHFDEIRWKRIFDFPSPDAPNRGGVVWLGPGEAAAARESSAIVVFYRNGMLHTDQPIQGTDIVSLTMLPGIGLVGGTATGDIVAYMNGAWTALPGSMFIYPVYAIAPYEDGFIYAGSVGGVGQYAHGYCPNIVRTDFRAITHIAPVGRDIVLIYQNGGHAVSPVSILKRI